MQNTLAFYLDGLVGIRVQDNGDGIPFAEVRTLFGSLGDSWKKKTGRFKGRALHGKTGQGRFKAFSLGGGVAWRTVYSAPEGPMRYEIVGRANALTNLRFTDPVAANGSPCGTEVMVSGIDKSLGSLLQNDAREELAKLFAAYLSQYPDIVIAYDGVVIDPAGCHKLLSRHATKADALPKDLRGHVEVTDRENVILTPDLEDEVAGRFLEALGPLERAGKLGALLLQMTPGFAPRSADLTALEPLLRQLKGDGKHPRRVVLELRHHDWLDARHRENTTAFLREQGVTLASIDGPPADVKHITIMPAVDEITDPRLAYLRLHGRDPKAYLPGKTVAERFHYDYSDDELGEITDRAHALATEADEVHVVFNNNSRDFAPRAAERLRHRLGQATRSRTLPTRPKQGELL